MRAAQADLPAIFDSPLAAHPALGLRAYAHGARIKGLLALLGEPNTRVEDELLELQEDRHAACGPEIASSSPRNINL